MIEFMLYSGRSNPDKDYAGDLPGPYRVWLARNIVVYADGSMRIGAKSTLHLAVYDDMVVFRDVSNMKTMWYGDWRMLPLDGGNLIVAGSDPRIPARLASLVSSTYNTRSFSWVDSASDTCDLAYPLTITISAPPSNRWADGGDAMAGALAGM